MGTLEKIISKQIPFDFRQLEFALISYVTDFEKKYNTILPEAPVYVIQTGDTTYYLNSKFQEQEDKSIYEKIPRAVIQFTELERTNDTDTNRFNRWTYLYENENYTSEFRRLQVNIHAPITLVSSNLLMALQQYEISLGMTNQENAFSYEWVGSKFDAKWFVPNTENVEFPAPEMGGTRRYIQKLPIQVETHIYVPIVETIMKLSDYQMTKVEIGLIENKPTGDVRQIHNLNTINND
jgi:hypothetical protein